MVRANKETMSRAEKLYDRLDALESEYSQMIAGELRRWITDGFSMMLHRAIFLPYLGRFWQRNQMRFKWLEKEIVSLRHKLNEPLADSPVGVFRALSRSLNGPARSDDSMLKPILRSALEQLKAKSPQ